MKHFKKLCLLLLLLLNINSYAGNIYGSDIFWKRLSTDTFQVQFTIYSDCSKPLDSIHPIISAMNCSPSNNFKFSNPISHITTDVTPRCFPHEYSKCDAKANINYGITENIFTYILFIGDNNNCCWYTLSVAGLVRDSALSNGNANSSFETQVTLNRCIATNTENVRFYNRPIKLSFKNTDIDYNHGVFQASNDSMSYRLANPANQNYISPYSATYPLACLGGNVKPSGTLPFQGFGIDSIRGDILYHPLINGYYILRMEAKQWKKIQGVYTVVAITNRELMFLVKDKPVNHVPNLTAPKSFVFFEGHNYCFSINSNDSDALDTTRIYWNKLFANATFSTNNGSLKHATGDFCWTPNITDTSCTPYILNFYAYDDHCFGNAKGTISVSIIVKPHIRALRQFTKINCHTYQFKIEPEPHGLCYGDSAYTIKWYEPKLAGTGSPNKLISVVDAIRYDFSAGGAYVIHSVIASEGHVNTYLDTLVVDFFAAAQILNNDSTIQALDTVLLVATTNNATSNNKYQWWAQGKLIDTTSTIKVYPAISTTYTLINKSLSEPCDVVSDAVTLIVNGTTGIDNKNSVMATVLNPIQGTLSIQNEGYQEMKLYSLDGKLLQTEKLQHGKNNFDVQSLPTGIYILQLANEDTTSRWKIIKTNNQ